MPLTHAHSPNPPEWPRRRVLSFALAIFAFALALRLIGIGWGLKNDLHNQSYHPDEPLIFDYVHKSLIFRAGDKEYYNYGTGFYALLRLANATAAAVGGVPKPDSLAVESIRSNEDWENLNDYVTQCHLAGRVVAAAAGSLTAMLVFLALLSRIGAFGAVAGAAFVALSPAHVMHSRFQTVDILAAFAAMLGLYFIMRLSRERMATEPGRRDTKKWLSESAAAGALCGLAAGTRYSNALLILGLIATLLLIRPRGFFACIFTASICSIVAFIVTTPGVVFDYETFLGDIKYQSAHLSRGHGYVFFDTPSAAVSQLRNLAVGTSVVCLLLAIVGVVLAARKHLRWMIGPLVFLLASFYFIGGPHVEVKFLRYGFPLYGALALGFGIAIAQIRVVASSKWVAAGVAGLALIGIESPFAGIRGALTYTRWMAQEDPRDASARSIHREARGKSEFTAGLIQDSWYGAPALTKDASFTFFKGRRVKDAVLSKLREPRVVIAYSPEIPVDVLTYSSIEIVDIVRLKEYRNLPPYELAVIAAGNDYLDQMAKLYPLVETFGEPGPDVHDLRYIQPTVWVRRPVPQNRSR